MIFRLFHRAAASTLRWVVLDVETTGLNPHADRLLAVAAVAVRRDGERLVIDLADSFDAVLQHDVQQADKENILLHGIGVAAMRSGSEPARVLREFAAWCGDAPRVGFHVAFDRAMIERTERQVLGQAAAPGKVRWLDLEPLAAVTHPEVEALALDEWMAHFGITCLRRHQAAADTLATAELMLRLWPRLRRESDGDYAALARLEAQRRWVRPRA